jgi:hypothetical protein
MKVVFQVVCKATVSDNAGSIPRLTHSQMLFHNYIPQN